MYEGIPGGVDLSKHYVQVSEGWSNQGDYKV